MANIALIEVPPCNMDWSVNRMLFGPLRCRHGGFWNSSRIGHFLVHQGIVTQATNITETHDMNNFFTASNNYYNKKALTKKEAKSLTTAIMNTNKR